MQTAHCITDDNDYTATEVAQLSDAERDALRGNLICPSCHEPAYYRSPSPGRPGYRGKSPCFFCRPHGPNCDITRLYGDPWEANDERSVEYWERNNKKLIVVIRTPAEATPTNTGDSESGDDGERSRGGGDRTRQSNNIRQGPQRYLEQLVSWPTFKTSPVLVRMPDPTQTEMPVHTAFVRFEDANADTHTNNWHGFWGIVPPITYWSRGESYYANFGTNDNDFRISIHRNQVPAILAKYRLARIEDLRGHYLLLFDRARISTSNRFTADVNTIGHIGFLRTE